MHSQIVKDANTKKKLLSEENCNEFVSVNTDV